MMGTFHSVSKKHLHRYCDEFEFRWNWRGIDDGARMAACVRSAEGKRLYYKQPTNGQKPTATGDQPRLF